MPTTCARTLCLATATAAGSIALGAWWRRQAARRRCAAQASCATPEEQGLEQAAVQARAAPHGADVAAEAVALALPPSEASQSAEQEVPADFGSAAQTALGSVAAPQGQGGRERPMGLRTLLAALQASERVSQESIGGPFQMSAGEEVPVVCFQFRMSHFSCKAYLAAQGLAAQGPAAQGAQEEGSQHLKLQTIFEDNRRSLGEEQRYFVANEWNATKRYTRLKCGSGGAGRSSVFTLEYDILCPAETPHSWGLLLLTQTLRMWYTSMVACVMHIVEPRDMPFATHEMITSNTLSVAVREQDIGLQRESCPICLEAFRIGEKVRRLPCMHTFHVVGADADSEQGRHCNVDKHLIRDKQCPVCKTPIDIMERMDRASAKCGEATSAVEGGEGMGPDSAAGPAADEGLLPSAQAATTEGSDSTAPVTEAVAELPAAAAAAAAAVAAAAAETGPIAAGLLGAPVPAGPGTVVAYSGLPAQAAELERAVRSLQSRWLQIQDVVQGMQQMLQYLEDNQTALGSGAGTAASAGGGPAVAATVEQAAGAPSGASDGLAAASSAVSSSAPAEVLEVAVPAAGDGAVRDSSTRENWVPFTEAEKICMAYAWRQRRVAMARSAVESSAQQLQRQS